MDSPAQGALYPPASVVDRQPVLIPHDTSEASFQAQMAVWQRLGPEGRVALAGRISLSARRLACDGIRQRHPDYSDEQVRRALLQLLYGDDIVQKMWPLETLIAP